MDGYLNETVTKKIKRDGMLGEGLSYSLGYLNTNRSAADRTRDYFLTRPADTPALVDAQANATAASSILQYGQGQMDKIRLPDTRLPAFGDTTFDTSSSHSGYAASAILPAYGHVAMGSGTGSQATQVNQSYCAEGNHMRSDVTAFVLYAKNSELLGNIRYHHSPGRQFDEQILAHNAVTIDRVNMSRTGGNLYGNGDLTLYEPGDNGLAVTEIDGERAYSNKASRYQRVMILNTADADRPYALDIFRITGGLTHDYVLHGAIRWDQNWECSFPLTVNPAAYPMLEGSETWTEPQDEGDSFPYYGFWREVSSGAAGGDHQITYRDTTRTNPRDLRLWMTDPGSATVYLGKTPVPERQDGNPPDFYKYWRPSLIERRRIASGTQQSLFAEVIEPMSAGASSIQSVTRVPIAGGGIEAVCVRVTFTDGRVDTILVNLKNPQVAGATGGADTVATADGQYSLTGRIGAHTTGPQGDRCWSVAASSFTFAGRQLSTPSQTYTGTITGETRKATGGANDAFITSAALPVGTTLQGQHLSLLFGSLSGSNKTGISEMFVIDEVKDIGGQRHVCFSRDHQLEMSGTTTTEQMAPLRTFSGTNQFEIKLGASAAASVITPVTINENQSATVPFGLKDLAGTPSAALTVTASSANPALIPNANLAIAPVPIPWTSTDIGSVAAAGNSTAGSTFTIQASGADFWGTADEGHYIYQDAGGDGEIIARVTSISNTNAWAKAGVMFRASTAAGSIHAHMLLSRSNGVSFQRRLTTGGGCASDTVSGITAPCWVRLVKSGTTLTGYYAPDNSGTPGAWVEAGSDVVPLGPSFLGGLAATSHNDSTLCTATFDNVSDTAAVSTNRQFTITPAPNSNGTAAVTLAVSDGTNTLTQTFNVTVSSINDPPTISDIPNQSISVNTSTGPIPFTVGDPDFGLTSFIVTASSSNPTLIPNTNLVLGTVPLSWTGTDVGAVAATGSSNTDGSTFTINASGADFWGTADEGHIMYRNTSGDAEILARVTSISNTNAWAKAGVMFRATTATNSPHALMLVSRSNGVAFQRRLTTGGSSTSTGVTGIVAPCWIRLVKSGTTLTGYYAPDNAGAPSTWVLVGSDTIDLGSNFLAALAATSHNNGTLCTATFDNVASTAAVPASRTLTITPASDRLGSATITVTVSDGTLSASDTFTVNVTGTPSQTWRFQNFATTANSGIAADMADPDKDGVVNLLEQALATDPNSASFVGMPVVAIEGGNLTLTYTRNKSAMAELNFAAEWANSAGRTWSTSGVSEAILNDNGSVQHVKAAVAISNAQKFMRLRITRP
jgi:hypothetical protein